MAIVQGIGHPYIHTGVNCDECGKHPIKGYRFKCQRRPDHDLCAECFYRQTPSVQQGFIKIERADNCRPYQIHYVECDECGAAPIHGPRYHHTRHKDYDVCASCFVAVTSVTNPHAEPASAFEMWEQSQESSNRKKHHPIYHFEVTCSECLVTPIYGPRYVSMRNGRQDLCLVCFDALLVSENILAVNFRRIERPDARSAVHVYIFCCSRCGATPICGPAYLDQQKEGKCLCLMCFLNLKKEKQLRYTRMHPPRQLNVVRHAVSRSQSAPPLHHSPPGQQQLGNSTGTALAVWQPQAQHQPAMMAPAMPAPMVMRGLSYQVQQPPMVRTPYAQPQMQQPQMAQRQMQQKSEGVGEQMAAEVVGNVAGQVASTLLGMMFGGGDNNSN